MNNTSSSAASGGIGILGLLTVLFVGLKLCSVINWSWWLVTLPLWGLPALFLGIAIICLIGWLLIQIFKPRKKHRRAGRFNK